MSAEGASPILQTLPHILLVEDHEDSARCLMKLLCAHGYTVEVARLVREALTLQRAKAFDVLLCDIELPDGNGLDLVQSLKREFPRLKSIAMSGYGTNADVELMYRAGFDAHLIKPFALEQITFLIKKLTIVHRDADRSSLRPTPDLHEA